MRVLRVIQSMDPSVGGPCQGIRNSAPELSKLGIETEVVCLDLPDKTYSQGDAFPVIKLGPANNPWGYSRSLSSWLKQNIHNFDVIIVHGLWQFYGHAVRKAMEAIKRHQNGAAPRVFVMPHGMLDPWFQKADSRKLKAIRNYFYWHLIEKKLINSADAVLFTCQIELELARQTFSDYSPKNEINVGYGISTPPGYEPKMTDAFLEVCPGLRDSSYLLFISRLHEKKGVELLIDAYRTLKAGGLQLPILVIAGPGLDSAYGQSLVGLSGDDTDIMFPGMLTGDAKWGAFYGSTCFILPSHQENFGIAVVEAMACGKLVLISNQVNIWKEIKQENAGLIEDDSKQGVENLLSKWQQLSVEARKEMGQNAHNLFIKKFTAAAAARTIGQFITKSYENISEPK